jgi:hypothetical protein
LDWRPEALDTVHEAGLRKAKRNKLCARPAGITDPATCKDGVLRGFSERGKVIPLSYLRTEVMSKLAIVNLDQVHITQTKARKIAAHTAFLALSVGAPADVGSNPAATLRPSWFNTLKV